MTNETHNTNATKPRRWFRFRLRTLLVIVTVLSVPLSWVGWELDQRHKEKVVVAWIVEMGGRAFFDPSFPIGQLPSDDKRSWWEKKKDKWFGERVSVVVMFEDLFDTSPLAELLNPNWIILRDANVSDEQVQELRLALPDCRIDY